MYSVYTTQVNNVLMASTIHLCEADGTKLRVKRGYTNFLAYTKTIIRLILCESGGYLLPRRL